jgi:hypothetical protein
MRKVIVLVVAACFVASAATVYAQQQKKERNLITIIQNSVKKPLNFKEKDKLRGDIANVTMFQSASNWIKEGSARARGTPSQREDNLITIIQGTFKPGEGKEKNLIRGDIGKVKNFQSAADWVSSDSASGTSSQAQATK